MSDPLDKHRARFAWRAAVIASALNASGWPLMILIVLQAPEPRLWPMVTASVVALVLLALLGLLRGRATVQLASWAFFANSVVVALALWSANAQLATQADRWVPFQANKLGVLTVALLTPELWVGVTSIALYTGTALVQWSLLDPESHARAVWSEPWAMLAYALFAVVLLVQGNRRLAIERRLMRSHLDSVAFERLARELLAIRDYTNTPLQTIASTTDLAVARHPELAVELEPIKRALDRLRALSQALAAHESQVGWRPGDEELTASSVHERLRKR